MSDAIQIKGPGLWLQNERRHTVLQTLHNCTALLIRRSIQARIAHMLQGKRKPVASKRQGM